MNAKVILGPSTPAIMLAAVVMVVTGVRAEEVSADAASSAPDNNATQTRTRLARLLREASLSPGVADVAKLGTTGAGELVMLAYVNNSEIPYKMRAEDIAHLSGSGVPDSIIAAMIERGAILRARQPAVAPAAPVPAVQNIIHAAPRPETTVVFVPAPVSYYSEPISTVTVIGGSHVRRGLSAWNRPSVYSRPGQFRNNVSYSVWGGYNSCAPFGRSSYKYGLNHIACR